MTDSTLFRGNAADYDDWLAANKKPRNAPLPADVMAAESQQGEAPPPPENAAEAVEPEYRPSPFQPQVEGGGERPLGSDGATGVMAELGRGMGRGLVHTLPNMAGDALKFFDTEGGNDAVRDFGEDMKSGGDEMLRLMPWLQKSTRAQVLEERGEVWDWTTAVAQGGEMVAPSLGPAAAGAAAGAALTAWTGPGAAGGAALGGAIGFLAGLPIFYGSEAQATTEQGRREALEKYGEVTPERAAAINKAAHIAGAIEGGGEAIFDLLTMRLGRLIPGGIKKNVAQYMMTATKNPLTMIKDVSKLMAIEGSTEVAQSLGQDAARGYYGIGEGASLVEAAKVLPAAWVMSAVSFGLVEPIGGMRRRDLYKRLSDPRQEPEQRQLAARAVESEIRKEDPGLAKMWRTFSDDAIANGKQIIPQPDEEWIKQVEEINAAVAEGRNANEPKTADEMAEDLRRSLDGEAGGKPVQTEGKPGGGTQGTPAQPPTEVVTPAPQGEMDLETPPPVTPEPAPPAAETPPPVTPEPAHPQDPANEEEYWKSAPPEKTFDSRIRREGHRQSLDAMVNELQSAGEKGGVSVLPDGSRTPSLYPEWAQEIVGSEKVGQKKIAAAVAKAKAGETLGVSEARIVTRMLDEITSERTSEDQMEWVRGELGKARRLRRLARQNSRPQTAEDIAKDEEREFTEEEMTAGDRYREIDYEPEWGGETRAMYELSEEANGYDPERTDAVLQQSNLDDSQVSAELWKIIEEGRSNAQTEPEQAQAPAATAEPAGADQGQVEEQEPTPAPVAEFKPTHELPDGTRVAATGEKDTYLEEDGTEVVDQSAEPLEDSTPETPANVPGPVEDSTPETPANVPLDVQAARKLSKEIRDAETPIVGKGHASDRLDYALDKLEKGEEPDMSMTAIRSLSKNLGSAAEQFEKRLQALVDGKPDPGPEKGPEKGDTEKGTKEGTKKGPAPKRDLDPGAITSQLGGGRPTFADGRIKVETTSTPTGQSVFIETPTYNTQVTMNFGEGLFEFRQRVAFKIAEIWDGMTKNEGEKPEGTGGDQVTVFPYMAGMSRRADFEAALKTGAGVGTVIMELTGPMRVKVADAIRDGQQVFVDSGAFSVYTKAAREGKDLSEIGFSQWETMFRTIMDRYLILSNQVRKTAEGRKNAASLMLVMPDVVGDQQTTERLLRTFKKEIAELQQRGHELIVPIQVGKRPAGEFFNWVRTDIFDGIAGFVAGIPSAEAAMSEDEFAAMIRAANEPARLHILGAASPGNKRFQARMKTIRNEYKDDVPGVTADSMRKRAVLNKLQGLEGEERKTAFVEALAESVPGHWRAEAEFQAPGEMEKEVEVLKEQMRESLRIRGTARVGDATYTILDRDGKTFYWRKEEGGARYEKGPGHPATWSMETAKNKAVEDAFGPDKKVTTPDEAATDAAASQENDKDEPTPDQKEAENYEVGRTEVEGRKLSIETPKGSYRWKLDVQGAQEAVAHLLTGQVARDNAAYRRKLQRISVLLDTGLKDNEQIKATMDELSELTGNLQGRIGKVLSGIVKDGWYNEMPAHYSRFLGTVGNDGDHLDAFIGPHIGEKGEHPGMVLVIDQDSKDGFDEHKVMLGFDAGKGDKATREAGLNAYLDSLPEGWRGGGGFTLMTWMEFDQWMGEPKNLKKRASPRSPFRREKGKIVFGAASVPGNEKTSPPAGAYGGKPLVPGVSMDTVPALPPGKLVEAWYQGKPSIPVLANAYKERLLAGYDYQRIGMARGVAQILLDKNIDAGDPITKDIDEAIELGIVTASREIIEHGQTSKASDQTTYDKLVELYSRQPRLGVRTSGSMERQAYSTPAPIAFIASRLAGAQNGTTLDTTSGNGMLLMGTPTDQATVNELDPQRADNLRSQGFEVTEQDATTLDPGQEFDSVIANPPFGTIKRNGKTVTWTIDPDDVKLKTGEIDHKIVEQTLKSMKDAGRAVLIIGSIKSSAKSEESRLKSYRQQKKLRFFHWLYKNYMVEDHFTVSGDLYSKQGAGWPIDVIVIGGRGETTARKVPGRQLPEIFNDFTALKDKLPGENLGAASGTGGSTVSPGGAGAGGATGTGPGAVRGGADGQGGRPAPEGGQPTGGGTGPGAAPTGTGPRPTGQPAAGGQPVRDGGETDPTQRSPAGDVGQAGARPDQPGETRPEGAEGPVAGAADEGRQPGAVDGGTRTTQPVGNMAEQFDEMSEDDFADLLDDVENEVVQAQAPTQAQAAPTKPNPARAPEPQPAPAQPSIQDAMYIPQHGWVVPMRKELNGDRAINHATYGWIVPVDAPKEKPPRKTRGARAARVAEAEKKRKKRTSKKRNPPNKPPKDERTQKEKLTSAADHTKNAMSGLLDAMWEITGANNVGTFKSGPFVFTEENYQAFKGHMKRVAEEVIAAGRDIRSFVKELMQMAIENNMPVEWRQQILKPALMRFFNEVKANKIILRGYNDNQEMGTDKQTVTDTLAKGGYAFGTVMPKQLKTAADKAREMMRDRLDERLPAEFLGDELGMTPEKVNKVFGNEQQDALMYGILSFERGAGFIIGDQTGVGKGRVVAGMIKYAMNQGHVPIFLTEKPTLYADMFRDLRDIGFGDDVIDRIHMTNNKVSMDVSGEMEKKEIILESGTSTRQNAIHRDAIASGTLPPGKGIIFTTYDQMTPKRSGEGADRINFITEISSDAMIIMDESHNAGGGKKPGEETEQQAEELNRAQLARILAGNAWNIMFSSATYAKRPEVMDLYARTDMSLAVDNIDKLSDAISKGGVPMQQVVASMLTEAGQYLRREKSYEGIPYLPTEVKVDQKNYDDFSHSLDTVRRFVDRYIRAVASDVQDAITEEGGSIIEDASTGTASVDAMNFTSIMHNIIEQMLLSIKTPAAIEMAKSEIDAGRKPVLTVSYTMETFLKDMTTMLGVKPGEAVNLTFNDVLKKYLIRSRTIKIKEGEDKREMYVDDAMLGPEGVQAYEEAMAFVAAMDLSEMPVFPIDEMRRELQKYHSKRHGRKLRVGEITGRKNMVDDDGALAGRPDNASLRRATITGFNSGEIDVVIVNQAGSTGISMHASENFPDQSQRSMIVVQPERNIDKHMQLLGRINRTGQVSKPIFYQMISNVPAENRPAAVLLGKMASLNANTTGARGSDMTATGVLDFINQYGDEVVAQIMSEHPETNEHLDFPVSIAAGGSPESTEGAARKVSGRIPLLPLEQQREIYALIDAEYTALIERLEASGENPLEAKVRPLDAKEISSVELTEAKHGHESPFAAASRLALMDVLRLGKPYSSEFVLGDIAKTLFGEGSQEAAAITSNPLFKKKPKLALATLRAKGDEFVRQQVAETQAPFQALVAETREELENRYLHSLRFKENVLAEREEREPNQINRLDEESQLKIRSRISQLELVRDTWNMKMLAAAPGKTVRVEFPTGAMYGIVAGIKQSNRPAKHPNAHGTWRVTIYVADSMRSFNVPLSAIVRDEAATLYGNKIKLEERATIQYGNEQEIDIIDAFDVLQQQSREERYVVTGNLLAGYDAVKNRGNIIYFERENGDVDAGIMMSREFDPDSLQNTSRDVALPSSEQVAQFAEVAPGRSRAISTDGAINVSKTKPPRGQPDNERFNVRIAAAKNRGAKYYLNPVVLEAAGRDFVTSGQYMTQLNVSRDTMIRIVEALQSIGVEFQATSHQQRARRITGEPEPAEQDSERRARFSQKPVENSVPVGRVQSIVDRLTRKWDAPFSFRVVDTFDSLDEGTKQWAREKQEAADKPSALVGFWDAGSKTFIVVADQMASPRDVVTTVIHEGLGHMGMQGAFGPDFRDVLTRVSTDFDGDPLMQEIYETYGLRPTNIKDRLEAAEEFLAITAQRDPANTLLNRVIAAVRRAIRAMGYDIALSRSEILGMISQARAYLRSGSPTAGNINAGEHYALRRAAMHNPANSQVVAGASRGQPVDKMFRDLFTWATGGTLNAHGHYVLPQAVDQKLKAVRGAINGSADAVLDNVPWIEQAVETARNGLLDRHGLPDSYTDLDRARETLERKILLRASEWIDRMKDQGVTPEESRILYDMLTGGELSKAELEKLAAPIRDAIYDMGREAVAYGLITEEAFQKNAGAYLHRTYMKYEAPTDDLPGWAFGKMRKARKQVRGAEAKLRGLKRNVSQDALTAHLDRDWWKRRKEAGKTDNSLLGEEFVVLQQVVMPKGRKPGVDGMLSEPKRDQPKGKVKQTVYWPAGEPIPARFSEFENIGTWNVRWTKGKDFTLWRDYSRKEREEMGEIMDAKYALVRTYQYLAHDLATMKFYTKIAENGEWVRESAQDEERVLDDPASRPKHSTFSDVDWVRVPKTKLPKSATHKWGALAGRYVRAEIWRDLQELESWRAAGTWNKILSQWKLNKTARNPVVHLNNVMSNLVFMDMADIGWGDLYDALKEFKDNGALHQEAFEEGAYGANFIDQELRRETIDPLLEEIRRNMGPNRRVDPDLPARVRLMRQFSNWTFTHVKKFDDTMIRMYQREDEVFRLATYIRRVKQGDTPAEAAKVAREQFLDYDIRAPWVNAARGTVLPFVAYTYRAAPLIAKSIAQRPWKLAKYATIGYALNAMAYAILGEDDEDEERAAMRDSEQGKTWIGVHRMMRVPWNDEHSNPVFLDIRRWIPVGDVFDTTQGQVALPAPVLFGGPLMLAAELMLNKTAFTGKEIVQETDSAGEKAAAYTDWMWKSWMPSAPWVYNSWYWDKIARAVEGGRDRLGRDYSVPQALISSAGVKIKPVDVPSGQARHAYDFRRTMGRLRFELRQAGQDLGRDLITAAQFHDKRDHILEKMKTLTTEFGERFPRSTRP